MEYECRLDTRDPDLWLECFNPAIFSNLTSGDAHVRGARHRRQREHRPDAGALHLDRRPAAELRPGQHHADRRRRRLGRRGQPDRELPLRDRARGPRPERPATRPPSRRSRSSAQNARALSASPCPPTRRAASSSRRRCASTPSRRRTAARSTPCRWPAPWKESTLTWFNQPGDGRRAGRRAVTRPRGLPWSGTSPTHVHGDAREPASTTAGRSATRTRTTPRAATRAFASREIAAGPAAERRCRCSCCATRRTDGRRPRRRTARRIDADRRSTAARCSRRARWSPTTCTTASARASSSAPRTSSST